MKLYHVAYSLKRIEILLSHIREKYKFKNNVPVWIQRFPLNPTLRFSKFFFFPSLHAFCLGQGAIITVAVL